MLAVILLAGCGGGGGGGSSSLYTGVTSPSAITDNNAEQIALQAYQAGDLSASTVSILGASGSGNPATDRPKVLTLVRLLKDAAEKTPVPAGSSVGTNSSTRALPMTVVTIDNTIFDGSGGSMSFTLSADDQTGEFTGTFRFENWHGDGGGVISGLANVSGTFDMTGGSFAHISFSFNPITMMDGTDSVTIYGTLDLSVNGPSASASMNVYLRNNNSGETVWIDNYTLNVTDGPDYVDTTVSGRIYLPNYGYVDVSTTAAFRYSSGCTLPASGVLVVTGSGGRSARLTVIDAVPESLGYYVEADVDGIPGYEWRSIDHPWT
jgi:hypothetical protein